MKRVVPRFILNTHILSRYYNSKIKALQRKKEIRKRRDPPVVESHNKMLSDKPKVGFRNHAVTKATEKAPGYTGLQKDSDLYEDLPRSQGYEDVRDPEKASYVNVS